LNPRSFFSELKRRNVYKVAVAYAVVAWLTIQAASIFLPAFNAPQWVMQIVILILVVGFPIALAFSWAFEITPEGIVRETEVNPNASITHHTGRKLVALTIVLAVVATGLLIFQFVRPGSTSPSAPSISNKSIAVLPFENLSDDKGNAYFSDGITEEILNALAQIPNLKVAARRSAFQFKGKDLDLRKIGQALGVAHILEGSLQKAGDQVRINVQLVDAQDGVQAWSEKFDRKLDNVFAVEDEIAKAIATKLRVQLTGGAGQPLVGDSTNNPQAHELYLRGLTLLAARGPGLREAVDAFEEAVRLDPNYAQALGALAETYPLLPAYGLGSMELMLPLGESAAQKALRINPDTASAHVGLGLAETYRCHWPDADRAFRRALTLAPGDAETVNQYAQFLGTVGQPELALREIDRAQQLDPLSPIIGVIRTGMLMSLHRDDAATAQLESILRAHPDFGPAQGGAMLVYLDRKLYPKAEAALLSLAKLGGETSDAKALIARGWADPAQRAAAVQSLETAPENANLRADPLWYALYLMSLGERSRALDQLEIYADKHNSSFGAYLWGRCFDPLRNDPRFKAVLVKLALPYTPPSVTEP
jgi:TolB-like protein/Tfp pilus assembly protein PilF